MLLISATEAWRAAHPGAAIGLLELSGIDNAQASTALNSRKREIETSLRRRYQGFARPDFLELPVLAAYKEYYRRFKKTYHVQLQVESLVLKGKSLPGVSPLVDANFMAEVETFVLSAGHDAAKLQEPIQMDVSQEGEPITQMNGEPKAMRAGDMIMRDAREVSCAIIYGQDNRSPITPETTHVLFVAYAPAGVPMQDVETHLQKIEEHIRLFAPTAVLHQRCLLQA